MNCNRCINRIYQIILETIVYELFMFFISIDEIKTSLYFSYDSTKSYYFWK